MNITILGSGVFGLSLAHLFFESKNKVIVWSKFQKEVEELKDKYLDFSFTSDMKEAVLDANVVILAVPIQFFDETLRTLQEFYQKQTILIASKGIHSTSLKFGYQMLEARLPHASYGMLSGGTFAKDMMEDNIMGITLATTYSSVEVIVKQCLHQSSFLKLQISHDVVGVSICGAIKNVMAIGLGMFDGMGTSPSSRYLFLTEVILEIQKIIVKLGGNKDTILSYAGIDDIIMTCTSSESRNYTLGHMIGRRENHNIIQQYKNTTTIEGLETSQSIVSLLQDSLNMFPFVSTIYHILYQGYDTDSLMTTLKEV